jgi:hypothetical protein
MDGHTSGLHPRRRKHTCCRNRYRQDDWPARIRLKPRWLEERKVYHASWPAPRHLQNGAGPALRVVEVFILRKAAVSRECRSRFGC